MRDTVVSEQVPSPPNKPAVKHSFHLDRLSVVEAPENLARKRKKTVVAVRGCMPIAFIHDIFEVMDGSQKNTNSGFLLDLTLRIILHCYIFLITSVVLGFSVDFLFVVMLYVLYVLS